MALSEHTQRIQITLNETKEKDKIILNYLSNFYDSKGKIKEILYLAAVTQGDEKLLTITNSDTKRVTVSDNKSEKKLLTSSNNKQQEIEKNELSQLQEFL